MPVFRIACNYSRNGSDVNGISALKHIHSCPAEISAVAINM
jgi:hypothetical protein